MKNQVEYKILILTGFVFVLSLFPFAYVDAAKLQSGVTINAPSTTQTEMICDDTIDNDDDGKIDAADEDCAVAPAGPTPGTCGLQIVSGVPINYGQLTAGQTSADKQVILKSEVTSPLAKLMVKGGNWISDSAPNPTISGPEITRVALAPIDFNYKESLSLAGLELGNIPFGEGSIPVYFQFRAWINGLSGSFPSGSFHQEVTIDLMC